MGFDFLLPCKRPRTRMLLLRMIVGCVFVPRLFFFCICFFFILARSSNPHSGSVFRLQHKYKNNIRAGSDLKSFAHISQLRAHDRHRHARFLVAADSFPLGGIADPNVAGLYFTEVELGTPPSKYYVQIDTGSDLLWVNCASCKGCPTSTQLGVRLALYDPRSSATSSNIQCGDEYCTLSSGACQVGEICGYQLGYGDGSSSQGYFVKDILKLGVATRNNSLEMANASVVFGCGTTQGGGLGQSDQALDGIMGFGQSSLSVISQLSSQQQASRVFAHCLKGDGDGGGILIIGDILASGLAYTSLIPNQPHYNVDLKSITVNGISIPVDSSASEGGGTIIDSGTTLAYFTDGVYQQLLTVLVSSVQLSDLFVWEGMTCTSFSGRVNDVFPSVTFKFDGNQAEIIVKPSQYLVEVSGSAGNGWCIGFQTPQSSTRNLNILGDLVLKDRLFVYDLEQMRISWVDYDCSTSVSVLSLHGQEVRVFATSIPTSSINSSTALVRHIGVLQLFCWLASLVFL